jgi:hypothetical protein
MERSSEEVRDARNVEALKLLKADPDKFFEQTRRRLPFGFATTSESEGDK